MMNNQGGSGGGLAVAALVCGILGLVGGFIPVVQWFTGILAILAIIFGVIARKSAPADKRGMATAGMVMGIIAVALTLLVIVACGACLAGLGAL